MTRPLDEARCLCLQTQLELGYIGERNQQSCFSCRLRRRHDDSCECGLSEAEIERIEYEYRHRRCQLRDEEQRRLMERMGKVLEARGHRANAPPGEFVHSIAQGRIDHPAGNLQPCEGCAALTAYDAVKGESDGPPA